MRVWKSLPSIRVLKILRGNPEERRQYLLAMSCYNMPPFTRFSPKCLRQMVQLTTNRLRKCQNHPKKRIKK